MKIGKLDFVDVRNQVELVSSPVRSCIDECNLLDVLVSEIDPTLSDTAAFCEKYGVGPEISANCVIIEAKRAERTWYLACVILATNRVDLNGIVRKYVDARKVSFAPMDKAVEMTGMEFGAITPIGLPADWTILVDSAVMAAGNVIIGSGVRKSKLLVPGSLLSALPGSIVMDISQKQA